MPVLGHAFVGLMTADLTRPSCRSPWRLAVWTPVVVSLAYLPDIIAQIMVLLGHPELSPLCHSMVLAVPVAGLVALLLRGLLKISFSWSFFVALVTIVAHNGLDLLAGGHHLQLGWPLSDRHFVHGENVLNLTLEILLFGGTYGLFLGIRWLSRRRSRPESPIVQSGTPLRPRLAWLSWSMSGLILIAAAGTHYLRHERNHSIKRAWELIGSRQPAAALAALDDADRWPSTASPGRIDYARAEAYAALGDRAAAERYYLRSYRAEPDNFWTLADLAVFYASSDEPIEIRRKRTAPYIDRLSADFAHYPAQPRFLAKIERKLGGRTSASPAGGPQ